MRHLNQQVGERPAPARIRYQKRGLMRTHEADTSNVPTSGLRDPVVENSLRDLTDLGSAAILSGLC